MKVFVTGGTGLVGSHVAEQLMRDGHEVRALVRPGTRADFLRGLGVELWDGDITEPQTLVGAMKGCDGLVHAAALVTRRLPYAAYRRVNVVGTENVLNAAVEQGLGRAVHVSSVAVYGGPEVASRRDVDESTPTDGPLPPGEIYGRSKREAEEVVWTIHRAGGLAATLVRPCVIYGERDRVVLPLLARYLASPVVFTVGRGNGELPLVYAGNVAQGILAALTQPSAVGRVYNLANDYSITQREFFQLLARALGRRPLFVPFPYVLAMAIAAGLELLARIRGRRPPVGRRHIAFMGRGNPFVSWRAREELGWRPEVQHEEAVARAVAWRGGRWR